MAVQVLVDLIMILAGFLLVIALLSLFKAIKLVKHAIRLTCDNLEEEPGVFLRF